MKINVLRLKMGYLIGIDGGGSKTLLLLTDCDKNQVSSLSVGSSNPFDIGFERSSELISDSVKELISSAGIDFSQVKALYAGIAGATAEEYIELCKKAVSELLPDAVVSLGIDCENIIWESYSRSDGVAVIGGTGSICFAKVGERLHRIGGYGLFDGLGSGYDIARMAISHALRAYDGREKRGLLTEMLEESFGCDSLTALDLLIKNGKRYIASFAPIVFKAYYGGDKRAEEILNKNFEYVAESIDTAAKLYNGTFEVTLAGGLFKDELSYRAVKKFIHCNANLHVLSREPVWGAVERAYVIAADK